jgi:hypothetical protein
MNNMTGIKMLSQSNLMLESRHDWSDILIEPCTGRDLLGAKLIKWWVLQPEFPFCAQTGTKKVANYQSDI